MSFATMLLVLFSQAAEAQETFQGEAGTTIYANDDELTVVSPWVQVTQALTDDLGLTVGWEADVITAASVDIVSQATAPFRDVRNEVDLIATVDQRTRRASLGYNGSLERDAHAHTFSASGEVELLERNLTLGLAYGLGLVRIGAWQATADLWNRRTTHQIDASLTQVLGPSTVGGITYTFQHNTGDLGGPYRRVPIFSSEEFTRAAAQWVAEAHPDSRGRHSVALAGRQAVSERVFLKGSWRGYLDTWAMRAHTGELGAGVDLFRGFLIEATDRLHWQSAVGFHRSVYTVNRRLITGDRRLGQMITNIAGLALRPRIGKLELLLRGEFHWTHYADRQILIGEELTDPGDVMAGVGQVGVGVAL